MVDVDWQMPVDQAAPISQDFCTKFLTTMKEMKKQLKEVL